MVAGARRSRPILGIVGQDSTRRSRAAALRAILSAVLRPLAILSAALLLVGMTCRGEGTRGAIVQNATAAPVQLAVFYQDGTHWQGSLEGNATARYDGDFGAIARLELQRPDGSLHRYDRARLDLLAKGIAQPDAVVLRIEADGIRAVTLAESERLAKERP